MTNSSPRFQFFDREAGPSVIEAGHLPHWSQAGTVCFITWRTWDSLPREVVASWQVDQQAWLTKHGLNSQSANWKDQLALLPLSVRQEYHQRFTTRWEDSLDSCHGDCVLRRPDLADIVADSLHYFDGERYLLSDFVVMPNHVHVLASFVDAEQMAKQCAGWKRFTANQINHRLRRFGRFWQQESFDHLVRTEEQFEYLRNYIADNPRRATLHSGEFIHYQRDVHLGSPP